VSLEQSGSRFVASLRSDVAAERDQAWRALFDAHYDRVYRLVCRFGVPPLDVEDVVQRAFEIACERIREVDDVRDAPAWLRGIVVRVVSHHRRWRRVRDAKRWLLRETRAVERPPVITPYRDAAAAEELARVRDVLGSMSGKLRDVFVLCCVEECTPREAAAALGIPVNTARSRRRLAREQFETLWACRYGGAA
jgi:RNA polymerase sigma-70 factor (ECF subfamily)